MKIKVRTEISNQYEDIEVAIYANSLTEEVQAIIDMTQNMKTYLKKVIGAKDNDIYLINVEEVICFYSEGKSNYCRTAKDTLKIKQPLYELEKKLSPKEFVRISNSCIININQVESFNTGIVGTIMVKFKDGNVEYVSRRRISQVMKTLKGGD